MGPQMLKYILVSFISFNGFCSTIIGTPDSDTAILAQILSASLNAVKATNEVVKVNKEAIKNIEEAARVVNEKNEAIEDIRYNSLRIKYLVKSKDEVKSLNTYASFMRQLADSKTSIPEGYRKSFQLLTKNKKIQDKSKQRRSKLSNALRSRKSKKLNTGYGGLKGNKQANVDTARNTSWLLDKLDIIEDQNKALIFNSNLDLMMKKSEVLNKLRERYELDKFWGKISSSTTFEKYIEGRDTSTKLKSDKKIEDDYSFLTMKFEESKPGSGVLK